MQKSSDARPGKLVQQLKDPIPLTDEEAQALAAYAGQLDEAFVENDEFREARAFYWICIYCNRSWRFVATGEQTLYCPECGEKVTLYRPAS
jgi:rubrerythrin